MTARQRVLTAYHEAGHTVVAEERGAENLRVSIRRTAEQWGIARARTMQFQILDRICIALAGPMAEWFYSGRWDWNAAVTDHAEVVEWHAQFGERVGVEEALRELKFCADDAARTLEGSWAAVDGLAKALLKREYIAHRQVIKMIDAVEGKVQRAPRRWSKRSRDTNMWQMLLNADAYRQLAADRGIDKEIEMGLVLVPRIPPKLRARMAAIRAEISALPKPRSGDACVIPLKLQRKQDAIAVALIKAQQTTQRPRRLDGGRIGRRATGTRPSCTEGGGVGNPSTGVHHA